MTIKALEKEMRAVSKLPHDKNEFTNRTVSLHDYPLVRDQIIQQAIKKGFIVLNPEHSWVTIRGSHFELQTHQRFVGDHTDMVSQGEHFGIFPVASKVRVKDSYDTDTVFNGYLNNILNTPKQEDHRA